MTDYPFGNSDESPKYLYDGSGRFFFFSPALQERDGRVELFHGHHLIPNNLFANAEFDQFWKELVTRGGVDERPFGFDYGNPEAIAAHVAWIISHSPEAFATVGSDASSWWTSDTRGAQTSRAITSPDGSEPGSGRPVCSSAASPRGVVFAQR
mgnify:CR=1 FL=1